MTPPFSRRRPEAFDCPLHQADSTPRPSTPQPLGSPMHRLFESSSDIAQGPTAGAQCQLGADASSCIVNALAQPALG